MQAFVKRLKEKKRKDIEIRNGNILELRGKKL